MMTGYQRREEREWNRTRHLMTYTLNYGGMGVKKIYQPKEIWPLSLDTEDEKRMITTMAMAMELYKEFVDIGKAGI